MLQFLPASSILVTLQSFHSYEKTNSQSAENKSTMRTGMSPYQSGLHRFSILLAKAPFFLIIAGAAVTSNEAGLSVPDWPLSYGKVMPEMKDGVFYEHG